ncbi:hypothetical protein AURDEDRAFT_124815 [Auricularia subglabra TFB-10046 SS5]|nr:hypothetical protein AURDEDRAFT_124815 [Auricularia subglabra TFB-10046 SS5]
MSNPFSALLRFVHVALALPASGALFSLPFALHTVQASSGTAVSDRSLSPGADRHALAKAFHIAWDFAGSKAIRPYAVIPRYEVLSHDDKGTWWVSPNAPMKVMPPPLDPRCGPPNCQCEDLDGRAGPRFGQASTEAWHWEADFYEHRHPTRSFFPNPFLGEGTCFKRKYNYVTTQWDDVWVVKDGDRFKIQKDEREAMEFYDHTVARALKKLGFDKTSDHIPAPRVADLIVDLYEHWTEWAASGQCDRGLLVWNFVGLNRSEELRACDPIAWAHLSKALVYDYLPVGAWFRDTNGRIGIIKEFIKMGVPVYYCWTDALERDRGALPLLRALWNAKGRADALAATQNPEPVALKPATRSVGSPSPPQESSTPKRLRWDLPESKKTADAPATPPSAKMPRDSSPVRTPAKMPRNSDVQFWEASILYSDRIEAGMRAQKSLADRITSPVATPRRATDNTAPVARVEGVYVLLKDVLTPGATASTGWLVMGMIEELQLIFGELNGINWVLMNVSMTDSHPFDDLLANNSSDNSRIVSNLTVNPTWLKVRQCFSSPCAHVRAPREVYPHSPGSYRLHGLASDICRTTGGCLLQLATEPFRALGGKLSYASIKQTPCSENRSSVLYQD